MDRVSMINRIGVEYHTSNIEGGEYSYVAAAGSKEKLEKLLGRSYKHFKLDIRLKKDDVVVLIETKQNFKQSDEKQQKEIAAGGIMDWEIHDKERISDK